MGISFGGSKRGVFAEVKVIPLIGILLVLWVIFMVIPTRGACRYASRVGSAAKADS